MSPPTILSIPRELRQHILKYAFNDAGEQDMKINNFLRLRLHVFWEVPFWAKHSQLRLLLHGSPCEETNETPFTAFFPHLYELALALRLAIPDLHEDMLYVLENALSAHVKTNTALEDKERDKYWRLVWALCPDGANVLKNKCPRARRMKPSNLL